MRYLIQFLVPALVIMVLAVLVLRNRGSAPQPSSKGEPQQQRLLSTGAFVTIVVVAAAFTVALVYELENIHH
jgi:hypothetical protein